MNPHELNRSTDFKSGASTNSATLPRDLTLSILSKVLNISKIRNKNTLKSASMDALDIYKLMDFIVRIMIIKDQVMGSIIIF